MDSANDQTVVLRRHLTFHHESRIEVAPVEIGPIEVDRDHCACWYSLPCLDSTARRIYGEDPLQAVQLCLKFIAQRIESAEEMGWQIWWLEAGDKGGFVYA